MCTPQHLIRLNVASPVCCEPQHPEPFTGFVCRFWQLIKPLLLSEFNRADITRVLGFVDHATGQKSLSADIIEDKWRPHEDIHAFMVSVIPSSNFSSSCQQPCKGSRCSLVQDDIPAAPFRDPTLYPFVKELEDNFDFIRVRIPARESIVCGSVTPSIFACRTGGVRDAVGQRAGPLPVCTSSRLRFRCSLPCALHTVR